MSPLPPLGASLLLLTLATNTTVASPSAETNTYVHTKIVLQQVPMDSLRQLKSGAAIKAIDTPGSEMFVERDERGQLVARCSTVNPVNFQGLLQRRDVVDTEHQQ